MESRDEMGELADAFNLMAARLDEYEHSNVAQLMFEKNRAEAVINSLQEAGFGVDLEGRVLFANHFALDLLGLKSTEIVGKALNVLCTRNDLLRHIVESATGAPFKIVSDGKEQFFVREQTPILKDGQALGFLYTLHNITTFQERDTAKTNFIATISHELKTPLAAADIGLKLLEKNPANNLSAEQLDIVHDLQRDNARLIKLVSELLDLSQVEAGRLNLRIAPVSVSEAVDLALAAVQSAVREKRIAVHMDLEGGLPDLEADREKTVWVLVNLLTNAIRYSPESGVIAISARKDKNRTVRLLVRDQGPGVPAGIQEKIFQPFFKANTTGGQNKSSGLGLSIAREFMKAMNGEIGVVSKPGEGAEFWIRFRGLS
ncbi:MAG: PAS domain S-box protein [Lewinellaceae bacterium]|nr:PAS domain S-box protein [Lewinellaceae bacterium]